MAVCACGSHSKTTFHQALAMNALGVVLDDFMLAPSVSHSRLFTFAMALGAQSRDVRGKRRRHWFEFPFYSMRPVTFFARRTVRIVLCHELPVHAYLILLTDFCVARSTINLLCYRLARSHTRSIYLGMALAARGLHMTGMAEIINPHNKRTPVFGCMDILPLMAAHTVFVRHALGVEHFPYFVGLVTVDARRQHVGLLLPQLPLDHFAMDDLNATMALRACCSDVLSRDRRSWICMWKNRMGRMT